MQRTPNAHISDEALWQILEALIDAHTMKQILHKLAEIAFQRGSDWRETARMIHTTAEAIPRLPAPPTHTGNNNNPL